MNLLPANGATTKSKKEYPTTSSRKAKGVPVPIPPPLHIRPLAFAIRSSDTKREPSQPPRGTEDDTFPLKNLEEEPTKDKYEELEGNPPTKFDGDRSKTQIFLCPFGCFVMMNRSATITKDPMTKCAYFLSLIEGPKVNGLAQWSLDWLNRVKNDPTEIPFEMNAWEVLEQIFYDPSRTMPSRNGWRANPSAQDERRWD
ncbi:hypothetical protein BJV74DRAFT_910148 [Russula compacta]|nr:hypothetical protein BJV74DRAFT_910148 [Russula compacta]